MTRLRRYALLVVLMLVAPNPAMAQFAPNASESADSSLARRCVSLETKLDRLPTGQWTDVQILGIVQCDQSGPPRVALLWSASSRVAITLPELRLFSMSLSDGRLAATLTQVAQDPSRSSAVRCAALDVLVGFAIPIVSSQTITASDTIANTRLAIGDVLARYAGPVPIPRSYEPTVHELVARLTASDPDSTTRDHSARLLSALDAERRFDSRPSPKKQDRW
jgi:hypothetical protein